MMIILVVLSILAHLPVQTNPKLKGECWMHDGKNKVVKVSCCVLTGICNDRKRSE